MQKLRIFWKRWDWSMVDGSPATCRFGTTGLSLRIVCSAWLLLQLLPAINPWKFFFNLLELNFERSFKEIVTNPCRNVFYRLRLIWICADSSHCFNYHLCSLPTRRLCLWHRAKIDSYFKIKQSITSKWNQNFYDWSE